MAAIVQLLTARRQLPPYCPTLRTVPPPQVSDDTIAAAAAFLKERSWEQPDTSNEAFMVADAVRMAEGDDDDVGGGGGASARPSSPGPNLFMRINRPASAGSPTAAMYVTEGACRHGRSYGRHVQEQGP